MAESIDALKRLAQQVRNAGQEGENTAERVGRVLVGTIENIELTTTKFKGYFTSVGSLTDKYSNPLQGDFAWVGESYPGTVYDVVNDQWHDTGATPDIGSVDLADYYKRSDIDSMKEVVKSVTEVTI